MPYNPLKNYPGIALVNELFMLLLKGIKSILRKSLELDKKEIKKTETTIPQIERLLQSQSKIKEELRLIRVQLGKDSSKK